MNIFEALSDDEASSTMGVELVRELNPVRAILGERGTRVALTALFKAAIAIHVAERTMAGAKATADTFAEHAKAVWIGAEPFISKVKEAASMAAKTTTCNCSNCQARRAGIH